MDCVAKEIPPAIVRWHGARKTESFLRDFFFQAEDGIRDDLVTGVQTCALPISLGFTYIGLGVQGAIIALVLYALLPIMRNTVVGLHSVDSGVQEAARGMGMTQRQ